MPGFSKFPLLLLLGLSFSSACGLFKKTQGTLKPKSFKNVMIAKGIRGDQFGPCEPSICVNPKNTQNIAAGAILDRYYWSNDGGTTWQVGKLKSSMGIFGDPSIVADSDGNFYYAHLSDPSNKQWRDEKLLDRIVIQKSTDGGASYNDGSFCGMRHPKDQDKHWLYVDPKTKDVFCTWTEFDKYESVDTTKDHSRILFSKSSNGGTTWTDAIAITQFEGDCSDNDGTTEGAVTATGPNGEVYVAWAWNQKIWFDRSTDGGKTWLKQDIIVADQPGGWTFDILGVTRCNGMPVLVSDLSNGPNRGTLYVNWSDQRNGEEDTDIWCSKSTDGGKTWSKALRVNNDKKGNQQFMSWMAIDQVTGNLYCVFYDRRAYNDKQTDVYLAISKDGGKSFSNTKISESPFEPTKFVFFGDYNNISANNGVVRPIWTRMENGVLSVWTALINME
jgi:hypothetical protein